jgi:hypothetical protein
MSPLAKFLLSLRKLQKTTTFGVRVLKNHHFSEKIQKTTNPPTNYFKKH